MNVRVSGGILKGRRLNPVKGANIRPTSEKVRGALFSVLAQRISRCHRVLDLYAGTGVLGIEALSRGVDWVDFVEMDYKLARRIRENLEDFSLADKGCVYTTKVENALTNLSGRYDVVFSDPPYDMLDVEHVMEKLSRNFIVDREGVVVLEHRYDTTIFETYDNLIRTDIRKYGDTAVSFFKLRSDIG